MDARNINTNDNLLVPKSEIRREIGFVLDLFFAIFYQLYKQNMLTNNNYVMPRPKEVDT